MLLFRKVSVIFCLFAVGYSLLDISHNRFASLPFSFGLVLNAYKSSDSSESTVLSTNHLPQVPNEPSDESETKGLQAISVAEVIREPRERRVRSIPSIIPLACQSDSVLELSLHEGGLSSRSHHFALVDDTHQITFEWGTDVGNSEQGEWLVSPDGQLEYQNEKLFYQCHSGDSYKLFDAPVHSGCAPVLLDIVELVLCK